MGIRVRLCSDWCLREADILSDYPQTSVSCIVRTRIPIFCAAVCRDYRLRTFHEHDLAAETKAEETTAAEAAESTEAAEAEDKFQSSILFCGSTSLYPIMSSLASSFTEEYVTWDKVDSSFPAENISIYVAPGGSGVGVSAAIDHTADFGMLARAIKDSEVEALGADYQDFIVARDALTVSVNAENPVCDVMSDMSTDLIRQIFDGEITTWD